MVKLVIYTVICTAWK